MPPTQAVQRDNPCEKVRIPSLKIAILQKNIFKKVKKKNAKNALTSHYTNGHGDPCDKWVKNQLIDSTLFFFQEIEKNTKISKNSKKK